MAIEFSIPQLLKLAGIKGYSPELAENVNTLLNTADEPKYQEALKQATLEITGYDQVRVQDESDIELTIDRNNLAGLSIYLPLILKETSNPKEKGILLDSAILELSRQRNIVTTTLQGRDSTVKEFINGGDFEISVSGLLCNIGPGYPKKQVIGLNDLFSLKRSIHVTHEVLNNLGINEMVITNYSFPNSPMSNVQPYSFTAINEQSLELTIDE